MQDRICSYDIICEGPQPSSLSRTGWLDIQDMPDILVGSLERAKPDGNAQKALTAPVSTGSYHHLSDLFGFAAIHSHGNLLFHVDFEQVFECVIVLVQPGLPYGDDKVEEGLEASVTARAVVLNSEDVIALSSSSGNLNTLAASHCHSSDQWLTDRVSLAKALQGCGQAAGRKKINPRTLR